MVSWAGIKLFPLCISPLLPALITAAETHVQGLQGWEVPVSCANEAINQQDTSLWFLSSPPTLLFTAHHLRGWLLPTAPKPGTTPAAQPGLSAARLASWARGTGPSSQLVSLQWRCQNEQNLGQMVASQDQQQPWTAQDRDFHACLHTASGWLKLVKERKTLEISCWYFMA